MKGQCPISACLFCICSYRVRSNFINYFVTNRQGAAMHCTRLLTMLLILAVLSAGPGAAKEASGR